MTVLVGFAGYARCGKDTAGAYLVNHYGFARRSFADVLREVLYRTDPLVPYRHDDTGHLHFVPLRLLVDWKGWEAAKAAEPEHPHGVRSLLQRLGTDAGRNVLGQNVWVDAATRDLPERTVFTDVRFPNEADGIRERGGRVVRLVRPGTGPVNDHPSETALDGYGYDATLYAEDVPQLHSAVADMVLRFGWDRR